MIAPASAQDPSEISDDALHLQEFVGQLTASQGRIRAFIVTLMPGSPDVADVLQETNLVIWKSRTRFKPGTNFLAWAFTIARLEVLHHRTRAKRSKITLISDELLDELAAEVPLDNTHESYLKALEACKSKLSKSQHELIENRYRPDRSLEEHARLTGRNASALRVSLMRIRTALKDCIEKSLDHHFA